MKKTYMLPATQEVAFGNGAPLLQDPVLTIVTGSAAPTIDEEENVE